MTATYILSVLPWWLSPSSFCNCHPKTSRVSYLVNDFPTGILIEFSMKDFFVYLATNLSWLLCVLDSKWQSIMASVFLSAYHTKQKAPPFGFHTLKNHRSVSGRGEEVKCELIHGGGDPKNLSSFLIRNSKLQIHCRCLSCLPSYPLPHCLKARYIWKKKRMIGFEDF